MREDYQREKTSLLVWLLSAMIAGFVIQLASEFLLHTTGFERFVTLSVGALKQGYVWTLATYPFLHRGVLHLLVVGLALFFVARELITQVDERRLAWLAVAAAAVGGLLWFGVHYGLGGTLMGASVVLWSYFTVFALLFPNREISFLVFFLIPITTRPKYILWFLLGADVLGLLLAELQTGKFSGWDVPHSAHLGAMLTGWVYYRYFHRANWLVVRESGALDLPRWMKRPKKSSIEPAPLPLPDSAAAKQRRDWRAEVDRILDKINSHGFNALTADEKRVLAEARESLSRR